MKANKLYKIIISDDRRNRGPTHFTKTRYVRVHLHLAFAFVFIMYLASIYSIKQCLCTDKHQRKTSVMPIQRLGVNGP